MIDVIDILHDCKSRDFGRDAGNETLWLLCIIAYHHELIIELRKESSYSFPESFVGPNRRTPILLVKPIRNFQRDMRHIEQVLLDVCAQITFIAKHQTIVVFLFDVLKIMEVGDIGRCHIITVYDTGYSADCVEFISVIMHALGCTVAPCGGQLRRFPSHCASSGSCVLTNLDRFGVDAEYVFSSINSGCYILSDFLAEAISQFATLIVLSPGDKIGEAICAFILQAMEQIVFAVDAENFRSGRKCEDFQIREPGGNTSTWYISEVIYTISGKFFEYVENFSELYDEVVHKRDDSNQWFGYH